jgi:hypothetical protein
MDSSIKKKGVLVANLLIQELHRAIAVLALIAALAGPWARHKT